MHFNFYQFIKWEKETKKNQLIPFLLDILCPYKDGGEQLTEDLILLWDTHNGQPFLKFLFTLYMNIVFSFISWNIFYRCHLNEFESNLSEPFNEIWVLPLKFQSEGYCLLSKSLWFAKIILSYISWGDGWKYAHTRERKSVHLLSLALFERKRKKNKKKPKTK